MDFGLHTSRKDVADIVVLCYPFLPLFFAITSACLSGTTCGLRPATYTAVRNLTSFHFDQGTSEKVPVSYFPPLKVPLLLLSLLSPVSLEPCPYIHPSLVPGFDY